MSIDELDNIDWNFRGASTDYLTHGFHPYRAKFIPQIPAFLIQSLSKKGDVVLDPFCGCGTTLVEAMRLSRNSIGVEINPLACLLSKVKTTPIEPGYLVRKKDQFLGILQKRMMPNKRLNEEIQAETLIPNFPDKEKWYHPRVLDQLGIVKALIDNERDVAIHDFLNVCFSSILKICSNQEEDFSYIADNMKPKKQRYVDVYPILETKLNIMVKGAIDFYKTADLDCNSSVIGPQSAKDLSLIGSGSVDLIVTSPPYAFTTDYTKMFRLSFYWFGWDVDAWKNEEIGARWKRGQKEAVLTYFKELELCFDEMFRVLRRGAYCCAVIGDSKRRKERIQIIDKLSKIGNRIASAKFCKKILREISSSSLPFQSVLTEGILVFRKDSRVSN